jgi:hypothetical protein
LKEWFPKGLFFKNVLEKRPNVKSWMMPHALQPKSYHLSDIHFLFVLLKFFSVLGRKRSRFILKLEHRIVAHQASIIEKNPNNISKLA